MKAEDEVQAIGEEAVLSLEDEAPVEAEIKSDEIEAVDKNTSVFSVCQHSISRHVQSSWTTA